MRLTLRTLLAYLDDVLDPVDKEELSQKIQSSEFAEDLVHRTRDTVRRLRLSAPQVIGTGMGLDPNTVAEYLDNVMPPEQVGDFERICLESDVHLAEATACHHVLTMVLGEPADVDPIARRRMYSIATDAADRKRIRVEPAHTLSTSAAVAAPVASVLSPAPTDLPASLRPHPVEVPDYLRATPWWRSTAAVIGLAAILLVGITVVFASGLKGWIGGKSASAPLTAQNNPPANESSTAFAPPPAETPTTDTADAVYAPKPESNATKPLAGPPQPMTPGLPAIAAAPTTPPSAANTEPDRYAVATNPPSNNPAIGLPAPSLPVATDSAATTPPQGDASNVKPEATVATLPANTATSLPAAPPLATPPPVADIAAAPWPPATTVAASNPTEPAAPLTGTPATPIESAADSTAPAKPAGSIAPPDSGTYLGGKTVLLRYDDKSNAWFRVEPRAAIIPGERVIALPEFRPKIALISGVHLDLSGGTQVVMGGGKDAGPAIPSDLEYIPTIELIYGRIVLINPSNGEKQVRLKLGNTVGTAKIARNATLAAEVDPKHVAGQDPRQTPAPVEIRLFAPDGGIVWQDAAGQKSVEKASRWTLTDAGASDPTADPAPPEWIDHEPLTSPSEQRFGAPAIETTLVTGAPVENQLLQLFQGSSRKEVKSLVTRCSIHVGVFQPFIDALRDSDQKANWKGQIEALRSAMALSPESANKVFQALVDQRGKPAAADLYEMLCGYSADQVGRTPEEMKNGAVSKLINWLEDDSLDYRVLAVQDLWEITGKRLMLNPADKLPERTKNVKHWRTQLAEGDLKVVQPAN